MKATIEHLKAGGILAYPTETVWGLGVLANYPKAIDKLIQLKGRRGKALSILVRDRWMAREMVKINERTQKLLGIFWPGPVTFVLAARNKKIAAHLGDSQFIGLRCSDHPFVQSLMNRLGSPLVTTSANRSGQQPAKDMSDLSWLPKEVLCQEGVTGGSEPSLIVKINGNQWSLLREDSSRQKTFKIVAKEMGFVFAK